MSSDLPDSVGWSESPKMSTDDRLCLVSYDNNMCKKDTTTNRFNL